MYSQTQENYLKCIYKLIEKNPLGANTNAIAEKLETKAATVTDMLKKLAIQKLIHYEKYQAVTLTKNGKKIALEIIRSHRLWEVFLVNKLSFKWNEVHQLAEQLEHIKSEELQSRLDSFLGYPKFDPHGDPIPDIDGKITHHKAISLSELKLNTDATIVGVEEHADDFLQYLNEAGIAIGHHIKVKQIMPYDKSLSVLINKKNSLFISDIVARNLLVIIK